MYGRLIRVNFKDEMTKDMIINYSDNKADKIGFEKHGVLQKLWLDTSKSSATLLLIFPNLKQCQIDHENQAKEFIEALKNQGNKVELSEGNLISTAYSDELLTFLNATSEKYNFLKQKDKWCNEKVILISHMQSRCLMIGKRFAKRARKSAVLPNAKN